MYIKIPMPIHTFLKGTKFWQDSYFILREYKHFYKIVVLALLFMLLAALFEGFGVGFILSFLQNLTNPNAAPIQTGVGWFDVWILGVNAPLASRVYRICGLILLTTWLRSVFAYLGQVYNQKTQLNLADRLRKRLFEQLQSLSLKYFLKTDSGQLVNSITSEMYQVIQALNVISTLITKGSILVVYLVAIFLLSWQLTIISFLLFSLLALGISTLLRQVREAGFETSKAGSWYTSVSLEFINGIRTVMAFVAQDFERRRFYDASKQLLKAATKSLLALALIEPSRKGCLPQSSLVC